MARVILERRTDWELKEATPGDSENIKAYLKNNIWQDKDADTLYHWKYESNPMGDKLCFLGTGNGGRIIATSFFMPWKLSVNGSTVGADQWVDLIVDREYRGQDIPTMALQKSLEKSRREGRPVCFAFPNNNSVPVHKKNNAIHVGNIVRYTKPLQVEYLVKRYIKIDFLAKAASFILNSFLTLVSKETYCFNFSGFKIEEVKICGDEFDKLWERCKNQFSDKVLTRKDSKYLRWKYAASPNKIRRIYSLKKGDLTYGFIVLESAPQIGYIVDVLASDHRALNFLITYAIKYFREEHKDSVVFVTLENNMYIQDLKSFGFVERPETKHFYIYLDEGKVDKEYFSDSKNWFITIGDCDIESL